MKVAFLSDSKYEFSNEKAMDKVFCQTLPKAIDHMS